MISTPQADCIPLQEGAPSGSGHALRTAAGRPARRPLSTDVFDLVRRLSLAAPLLALLAFAYHATLGGLVDELNGEGPLAYAPLLGLAALATASVIALRFRGSRPPIQDRFLDMLFGVPLLGGAVALITVLPTRSPVAYWTERLDILSLILFAAGVLIVVAGVPWFWRMRGPLLLLALMWPPLQLRLTAFVAQGLATVDHTVFGALGSVVPSGDVGRSCASSWLTLPAGDHPLSFAPCSGTHGLLDVTLLGGAVALCVAGRPWRKLLWLAGGATLACLLNWVWVAMLMVAGSASWLDAGPRLLERMAALTLTMGVMLPLLRRYGVQRHRPQRPVSPRAAAARRPTWSRRWMSGTGIAAVAAILPVLGTGLPQGSPVDPGGSPVSAAPFGVSPALRGGWMLSPLDEDAQVSRLVDSGSHFRRYTLTALTRPETILVDVLRTDDADFLTTHRPDDSLVERGDTLTDARRVDLGGGVSGLLLDYRESASNATWAAVSWVRPVIALGHTTYERVSLRLRAAAMGSPVGGEGAVAVPALSQPGEVLTRSPISEANRTVEEVGRLLSDHAGRSTMPAPLAVGPGG